MCGGPKIVKQDPEADAKAAAEKATAESNAKRAARRTANSGTTSVLGGQAETKSTLGGG